MVVTIAQRTEINKNYGIAILIWVDLIFMMAHRVSKNSLKEYLEEAWMSPQNNKF